jgi:hypothetical protein
MNLALACVFLLMGSMLIAVSAHGLQATTPWQLWSTILGKIREA